MPSLRDQDTFSRSILRPRPRPHPAAHVAAKLGSGLLGGIPEIIAEKGGRPGVFRKPESRLAQAAGTAADVGGFVLGPGKLLKLASIGPKMAGVGGALFEGAKLTAAISPVVAARGLAKGDVGKELSEDLPVWFAFGAVAPLVKGAIKRLVSRGKEVKGAGEKEVRDLLTSASVPTPSTSLPPAVRRSMIRKLGGGRRHTSKTDAELRQLLRIRSVKLPSVEQSNIALSKIWQFENQKNFAFPATSLRVRGLKARTKGDTEVFGRVAEKAREASASVQIIRNAARNGQFNPTRVPGVIEKGRIYQVTLVQEGRLVTAQMEGSSILANLQKGMKYESIEPHATGMGTANADTLGTAYDNIFTGDL